MIEQAAHLESNVLIEQVKSGQLPTIDLHLPIGAKRIDRLRQIGLSEHVFGTRLKKIIDEFDDINRTTFVASIGDSVVGIGRVRIRPELDTAVIYGFNIAKDYRGSQAVLLILEQCVDLISEHGSKTGKDMKVRINRYSRTERKKPTISSMANRLNHVHGSDTVRVENDIWDGEPFVKFTMNLPTFAAMVDRYGNLLAET